VNRFTPSCRFCLREARHIRPEDAPLTAGASGRLRGGRFSGVPPKTSGRYERPA
jgi:hypothetical protein